MTMAPRHRYPRLSAVDRMYLAIESPTAPMHFGALAIVDGGAPGAALLGHDGRVCLAEIRRVLDDRVRSIPELRRVIRPVGPLAGPPLWVEDPAFRIERHVGAMDLPNARAVEGEAGLLRLIEQRMAPSLDRAHPLWQAWFIGGMPDRRVAMLFMIHHAMADGLSAWRLARDLLAPPRATPEPPPMPTAWSRRGRNSRSTTPSRPGPAAVVCSAAT